MLVQNALHSVTDTLTQVEFNVPIILYWLAAIWILNVVNWFILRSALNVFGIYPRRIRGLIGIVISPFLHGNFNHLFFNSLPLFALANFVMLGGQLNFYIVSLIVILLSGILVWLFGRRAIHIGASGLNMGYFGYLLVDAVYHPTVSTVVLAIVTLYYFAGLFMDLFPSSEKVSWEAHIFGFLAGLASSYLAPLIMSMYLSSYG